MAWNKLKLLGSGSFGSVYLAAPPSYFMGSPVVAVKCAFMDFQLSFQGHIQHLQLASLKKEASLLRELRGCEYIVQGFGSDASFEYGKNIYNLVMEYAPGGTFDKIIKAYNGSMAEYQIATYTYMLLKGLSNVHRKDIAHCDFKPSNILVFPTQDMSGISLLKIADFGSSKKVWQPDLSRENRCTLLYASPESVMIGLNDKASDIWSLGCIVIEMVTGRTLWNWTDEGDLSRKIARETPNIPQSISEDLQDFLKRCLDRDWNKRWNAEMLLNHPFIIRNMKSSSTAKHQEVISSQSQTPWFCSNGMFSRPLNEQPDRICKPYQLFPEQGGWKLQAFGGIC